VHRSTETDPTPARREAQLNDEIRAINARLVQAAIREEQLAEQAQAASRAKSDFLALVSHELRTPLTAVIGYAELMQTADSGVNERGSAWAERIRLSASHLRQIVDDIISTVTDEHSRDVLRPETAPAADLVRDAVVLVEPSAVEKGLEVRVHAPAHDASIHTDQRRARQVLTNLLFNAVKFTDTGFVEIDCEEDRGWFSFHVHDSGMGIDAADLERIFEPFVQVDASSTRRFGGCGLGLGLSRSYARLLGGDLTVASSPGSGSTFTFRIPARLQQPAAAAADVVVRRASQQA
jgi:signal transduction histidine kinase